MSSKDHKNAVTHFTYNQDFRDGNVEVIVKVQLPIYTNDPDAGMLVYDYERILQRDLPVDNQVVMNMPRMQKAFFYATWNKQQRNWSIGERAPDQSW